MGRLVGLCSLGQDRLKLRLGEELRDLALRLPLKPNSLAEEPPCHLHLRKVEGDPLDGFRAAHGGRPCQGIGGRPLLHHAPELCPLFRAGGQHPIHKGPTRNPMIDLGALGRRLERLLGLRAISAKDRPPYGHATGHQPARLPHPR